MKKDEFSTKCNQTDYHRMPGGRQEVGDVDDLFYYSVILLDYLIKQMCFENVENPVCALASLGVQDVVG